MKPLNVVKDAHGKVIAFEIDKQKWARGGINGEPKLLNDRGNRCCLGFYCGAVGVSPNHLDDLDYPSEIEDLPAEAEWLTRPIAFRTDWPEDELSRINDSTEISDIERQSRIAKLFAEQGIAINFI